MSDKLKEFYHMTTKIVVDFAKLREIGGGNIRSFCHEYNVPYQQLYALNGKKYTSQGSKSQAVYNKLYALGAVKVIEVSISA